MSSGKPLLVFDTNILVDIWLGRGNSSVLLLQRVEAGELELMLPEYVLVEFRGTALRFVRDQRSKLPQLRATANDWARSSDLGVGANQILDGMKGVENQLTHLVTTVDAVKQRLENCATVVKHTLELHLKGDLRFLGGHPPDRPVDGLKDCRIYEALLAIAVGDATNQRARYFVTSDNDFAGVLDELQRHGFELTKPGPLIGRL